MTALALSSRGAVLATLEEFDRLGRDAFLAKYGYGRAREYFVLHEGRYYDSKAVAGVAYGREHPDAGPLPHSAFSGGEATVKRELMRLGLSVVRANPGSAAEPPYALVLVENEVTSGGEYDHWADATGVRYHFPNQYRKRVQLGGPFVYYRGVRRAGGARGSAEYFGKGVIGATWNDPEQPADTPARNRRWYCAIEDFEAFASPVPAITGGTTYETVRGGGHWRTAVRPLTEAQYLTILAAAGAGKNAPQNAPAVNVEQASLAEVLTEPLPTAARGAGGWARKSARAKAVGDLGEGIVYRWLYERLTDAERDSLDWLAQRGETPGWDIQYTTSAGARIAVEVKATTATRFTSFELTSNEWRAAQAEGEAYVLALVARVESAEPRVALLWDPARAVDAGQVELEPVAFRLMAKSAG